MVCNKHNYKHIIVNVKDLLGCDITNVIINKMHHIHPL